MVAEGRAFSTTATDGVDASHHVISGCFTLVSFPGVAAGCTGVFRILAKAMAEAAVHGAATDLD